MTPNETRAAVFINSNMTEEYESLKHALAAEFEQVRAEGENAECERCIGIARALAEGKEYNLEDKAYNDGCHAVAEAIRARHRRTSCKRPI